MGEPTGNPRSDPRAVPEPLRYKRSRFTARLPVDRLYAPNHYWAQRVDGGDSDTWRVGLTRFAVRMLGDVVEFGFEVRPGAEVRCGQVIGWVEAFKAVSDVYCIVAGRFAGHNAALDADPALIDRDAHGDGWLYAVEGTPDPRCVDAAGYAAILDAHIDKMLGDTRTQGDPAPTSDTDNTDDTLDP